MISALYALQDGTNRKKHRYDSGEFPYMTGTATLCSLVEGSMLTPIMTTGHLCSQDINTPPQLQSDHIEQSAIFKRRKVRKRGQKWGIKRMLLTTWSPFLHYVSYHFTAISPGLLAGPSYVSVYVCVHVYVCLLYILCSTPSWGRQIEAEGAVVWL